MNVKNSVIKDLVSHYKTISHYSKILALLEWDMNVNLPKNASLDRAEQISLITDQITTLWNNKSFIKNLNKANNLQSNLTDTEKAIIRNLNRLSKYYLKVPPEIISEKAKTTSEAFMVWQQSKASNDFESFAPYLKKIIKLNQIIATHLGYTKNPYDALLDQYEPGLSTEFCKKTFKILQPKLTTLIKKIIKSKKYNLLPSYLLQENYSPIDQKRIAEFIIKNMEYDFESGRIDISTHPFETVLGSEDIRITNMYRNNDFRSSLYSAMHETGHALYEQNIDKALSTTPLEGGVSYAIHESQSRFWENQVGKNPIFINHLFPTIKAFYSDQFKNLTPEKLALFINMVKPGPIRIEADEVTYCLHIILRFELEDDLINNRIKVEDLPKIWNEKIKKYLGIEVCNNSEGVLQDVHWSSGYFGYFPSYALGNLYAAQFLNTLIKKLDFNDILEKGELQTILFWLKDNIYKYGSIIYPEELVKKVTGENLNPEYFINYLTVKYTTLYQLKD